MTDTNEPRPSEPSPNQTPTQKDVEHFKHELEFLENVSGLIDALRKYGHPDRKAYTFEIAGMSRDIYAYPKSLDEYIGKKEFSSITVTVSKEEGASSTTIEMFGSFGRVYISRDSITSEQTAGDQLISNDNQVMEISRIPDAEINDFLFSLTGRGEDPAETRKLADKKHAEKVIGEGMLDALEATAISASVDYTYDLGDGTVVWFRIEGTMGEEKLTSVTLRYRDRDMNSRVVDVTAAKGLDVRFKSLSAKDSLLSDLYPIRIDYAIALRIIREETAKLIKPTEGKRPISLSDLPASVIDQLSSNQY